MKQGVFLHCGLPPIGQVLIQPGWRIRLTEREKTVKTPTMKHVVRIHGKEVELTTAEAKRLLSELKDAFGEDGPVMIPQPYPVPMPYPVHPHIQEPWIVTCEAPRPPVYNPMLPSMIRANG